MYVYISPLQLLTLDPRGRFRFTSIDFYGWIQYLQSRKLIVSLEKVGVKRNGEELRLATWFLQVVARLLLP